MHVKEQTEPLDRNAKNSNLFGDDSNAYSTEFELRNCIEDFSVPPPLPQKKTPDTPFFTFSVFFLRAFPTSNRHSVLKLIFNRVC